MPSDPPDDLRLAGGPRSVSNLDHLVDPLTGNGLSVAFFEDGVDAAEVSAAIARKADEIGWNDVPRPTPKSETIYRVIRGH